MGSELGVRRCRADLFGQHKALELAKGAFNQGFLLLLVQV
jgi:hypothetical protein